MKQSYELWVLADEVRVSRAIESCVHAAGHRIAGMASSVAELRICIAQHRTAPARGALVLLIDPLVIADADSAHALAELVRSSGLPVVQLAPEFPPELAMDQASHPARLGANGHVTCALSPRELALAVELALARHELARAGAERTRYQDEVRQLSRALDRRTSELQAVKDELEALGYSVSHDLRSPLRAIEGLGKILLSRFDDQVDPRIRSYLQHISDASQRVSHMIGELLSLSRLMRREMHIETCDLSAMARDILAALQQSSPDRAVEIAVAPDIAARADRTLLRTALENLLGNAWKFTSGTPAARIEVGVTSRGGQMAYFVRDNGIGFDMASAEKLFGVFQRMYAARDFEGSGMGLAKVQRIVRRHGGDIWAEAALGRGATFTFTLSSPTATTA